MATPTNAPIHANGVSPSNVDREATTNAPPQANGASKSSANGAATTKSPSQTNGAPSNANGATTANATSQINGASPSSANGKAPRQKPSDLPKPAKSQNSGLKKLKPKKPPGGYDPTPLPNAPPGYTVRFGFQSASNLPPADIGTASSDPFLTATLKASNPKRHKEEADLVYRTRTIRRTTEPEWNEDWVVANVPRSGFTLKCRLYDEDQPDKDDRLGNVTIKVPQISENWAGFKPPGKEFMAKKRMISKRAFVIKGCMTMLSSDVHITPKLRVSIEVLGKSDPPYAQMCTISPTTWIKHYSPMIGRIAGTKVDDKEEEDQSNGADKSKEETTKKKKKKKRKSQKYDFQANEMQLQGPVPSELYHRFVEFRPVIGSMFTSKGLRGKVLHTALRKQHSKIYSFDNKTELGRFEACSEEASMHFLKLAHFDEGGRVFTYVLTLDGMLRFTETGKEFGIDLLSKHTMHSDVQTYIACSGEFFVRRLQHPDASEDPEPNEKVHPSQEVPGGPPKEKPPQNPSYYQLIIDNDSGTYRPDKRVLPKLKEFLEKNFPGLGVICMHWEDKELQKLKEAQRSTKKKEGRMINVVMNRSQSSISSAESELDGREGVWEHGKKSKREAAFEAVEHPSNIKQTVESMMPKAVAGQSSK